MKLARTFLGSLAAGAIVWMLGPVACAAPIDETKGDDEDDGSVGAGGDGGTGGDGGSGGQQGPCVTAADCAGSSDECNVGTCINGACAKSPTNEGVACDDGKQCTSNDLCQAGTCTGTPKFCPATDVCHVGECDLETDACVEKPGNDGVGCTDEDACTATSVCSNGQCVGSQPTDCSFLDGECVVGTCDPALGCLSMPANDGAACNDGFFCTIGDQCTAGVCGGVPNPCGNPADTCSIETCNEAADICIVVPGNDGTPCDDQNPCTMGSVCSGGQCANGVPANRGGACDDGNACTSGDICTNGLCVGTPTIVACIDGDGCCPPSCDIATDADCIPACCGDDQNPAAPDNSCFQGADWIAWQYIPTCSFNVTRIEIHSDFGSVALLSDNNGSPGMTLFQGVLGPPDPSGFIGADVAPPIALAQGQTYWIAEQVGMCSIAQNGTTQQPYFGSFSGLGGPWDGPFVNYWWTSHVIGECP